MTFDVLKSYLFCLTFSHRVTEEDFTLTLTVDDRNTTTDECSSTILIY